MDPGSSYLSKLTWNSYLTRDISELLNREKKYGFDNMIYVIASEQDLHVKQFFKVSRAPN